MIGADFQFVYSPVEGFSLRRRHTNDVDDILSASSSKRCYSALGGRKNFDIRNLQ